jgi:hypothetical protein
MNEIKCPKCGEVFKVDESGYAAIVKEIRDEEFQKEQNNLPEEIDDKVRTYKISLDRVNSCNISVQWTKGGPTTWINVDPAEDGSNAKVQLNINHPFFKPFSAQEDFKIVLEKFAIAFALAEIRANKNANEEGSVSPRAFRNYINDYLRKLSEEE